MLWRVLCRCFGLWRLRKHDALFENSERSIHTAFLNNDASKEATNVARMGLGRHYALTAHAASPLLATTGVFTSRGPTAEQHPQDGTTCLHPSHDERGCCHTPPAGEPRPPRLAAHYSLAGNTHEAGKRRPAGAVAHPA